MKNTLENTLKNTLSKNPYEHSEQVRFVNWVKKQSLIDPIYEMLFAIPNGGKRSLRVGADLKLEGVKPGVPDLMFAVPKGGYHGLFIEMKRVKGGYLSKEQKEWRERLLRQGYEFKMARGCDAAIKILKEYLDGENRYKDTFAEGYKLGKNSRIGLNKSGCVCTFDEQDKVVAPCQAHLDWRGEK